jgi:hypothetical protein
MENLLFLSFFLFLQGAYRKKNYPTVHKTAGKVFEKKAASVESKETPQKKSPIQVPKKMDRVRSALTGVNILIALASLALVLIVISRIPRVRAFLASVMPKRPVAKPLLKKKPERDREHREHRERPPVSDTESDEEIERLEREAICRARPVIVPLTRPAVIEEIESDADESDADADAAPPPPETPETPAAPETPAPTPPETPASAPGPVAAPGRRTRAVK